MMLPCCIFGRVCKSVLIGMVTYQREVHVFRMDCHMYGVGHGAWVTRFTGFSVGT